MKQSFTQLIAQAVQARRVLISSFAVVAMLAAAVYVYAAVGVTVSGGGTFPISADLAANATQSTPGYTSVGTITITEQDPKDISASGDIVLQAPTGWKFNTGASAKVDVASGETGNASVSVTTPVTSADGSKITISLTHKNGSTKEVITITGVQVQALNGANIPGTGSILVTVANNAVVAGLPFTLSTTLSQKPGAVKSLAFTQEPSTVSVAAAITSAPKVTAYDQFGTVATNATGSIGVALSGTPGSALISPASGATASLANGIATFTNIRIDEGGNFQLVATYSGNNTVQATSTAFVVNNLVPTVSSALPCITVGSGINTITVTGTNFIRKSVVRINGTDRPTTFIDANTLTATLTSSDVGTAQTLPVTVFNPSPSGGTSDPVDFVIHPVISAGTITGETEVCESAEGVTYSVAPGAAAYNWTVGPGATFESGSTPNEIIVDFSNTASSVNISVVALNACGVAGPPSAIDVTVTPYPVVNAGNDVGLCTGTSATLGSGDPAVPGYTYQWSPTTGLSDPTVPNPTVTLTNSGTTAEFYNYTLTVTNGEVACEVTDQVLVTVYPELVIAADDVEPVCVGNQIELRVSGAADYTYSWTGPDGFASSEQFPVIPNATEAKEGTYTVVVTNLEGCQATATVDVTIAPLPTANAGADQSLCTQGASTAFTVTGTPSAGAVGTWSVVSGTATIASPTSLSTQVSVSSANATLRFTAETPEGCQATDDVVLTVNPLPNVSLAPLSAVCESVSPFSLSGGSPANGTYSGPGVVNGVFNPATAGVGTHTITYTFTNSNGCTNTASQTITVKPQPVVSVASSTGSFEICLGGSLTLTASGATTYRWEPASGLSATTGKSVTVNPTTNTTYTVYGTTNGCESAAETVTVIVNPLPDVAITPTGPTEFCDGQYVDLVTENVAGYTYLWFDANSGDEVGTSSTFRAIDTGSYYVTISTDKGCTLTSEAVSVIVAKLPNEATVTAGTTTFCQGGSVQISANLAPAGQTYEYTWESSSDNVNFTAISNPSVTQNTYVANASGFYRVQVKDVTEGNVSDCFKTSQSIQVAVLPQPTASITTSAQTQCQVASGNNVFTVTGTYSGGTGTWSATNGFTITGSTESTVNGVTTTTATVTAPASYAGSATVSLLATNSAASCAPASDAVTVTIQPLIVGNTISGTSAYCLGADATALGSGSLSGGNGNYTYQWQSSSSATGTFTNIGTATQASYTPSTATGGTVYYRRLVTSGECQNNVSNVIGVTVTPSITTNTIAGTQNYCEDEAATALGGAVAGGNGSYTYQWQSSSSATGTFTNIGTATQASYTPSTATGGTVYYRRLVTSGECQNNVSNVIGVTVTPAITANNISGTTTYCQNEVASALGGTVSGGIANKTYQWQQSATLNGTYTNITTATAANYTPSTATAGTTYYRRVVTSGNCSSTSTPLAVTINPTPGLPTNVVASPASVCGPGSVTLSATVGANGSVVRWYAAPSGGNVLASGATHTVSVNSSTTYYASSYNTSTGCESARVPVSVTVNAVPTLTITNPAPVCSPATVNLTATAVTAGSTSGLTYTYWTNAAATAQLTNPSAVATSGTYYIKGTTSAGCAVVKPVVVTVNAPTALSFSGLSSGDVFYTDGGSVTLTGSPSGGTFTGTGVTGNTFSPCSAGVGTHTITYSFTNSSGCPSSVTKTVTVKKSAYTVVIKANPFPICRGQNTNYTAYVYRDVEVIYPYMTNEFGQPTRGGVVIGDTDIPDLNPDYVSKYVPAGTPSIIVANAWRFYQPVVLPEGAVPVNQADINGNSATQFNYKWTKNDGNPNNGISGNRPTFSQSGLSSTDWYAVEVTPASATTCSNALFSKRLSNRMYLSEPDGYTITMSAVQPWCFVPNDQTTVTISAQLGNLPGGWSDAGLTYIWYIRRNGQNIALTQEQAYTSGATISTTQPRSIFQNGDQVFVDFTTTYDSYQGLNSKCLVASESDRATITINQPAAIASISTTQAVCSGSTATLTVSATGAGPLTYQWYKRTSSSGTSNGVALSDNSRISGAKAATLNITGATASDAGLYYVVITGSCPPPVESANIQLNITPLPTVYSLTSSSTQYCAGAPGVTIGLNGSEPSTTYNLLKGGTVVATVTRGASQSGPFNFPGSFTAGTYTATATTVASQPSKAACPQTMSGSVAVTENALPIAVTALGGSYCEGFEGASVPGAVVTLSGTQPGVSYQLISSSGQAVGSAVTGGGTITLGPVNAGNYTVRATNASGCTSNVGQATVIEDKRIIPLAEIVITNESGQVITANQLETGGYARFTAVSTYGDNEQADSYTWYTGDGSDGDWEVVDGVTGPVFTLQSVPGGMFSVQVIVTTNESNCYTKFAIEANTTPIEPLPVELIYLNASRQGQDVQLEWATASEKDNTGFEVQVSQDGVNFSKIAFVETKNGNSSVKQVYRYTDKSNGKYGTRYYRLKQVDAAGTFEYFGPKVVTFGEVASQVKAFPNPFTTELTLDIAAEQAADVQVIFSNAVGRQVMERTIRVEKGFNKEVLEISPDLPYGVYFIRMYLDGKVHHLKLLKQ